MTSLSIIIPSYNRPRYLARSLDYWSRSPFEIVVATNVQFSDPRATILSSDQGFLDRVSSAVAKTSGAYCALCPDDDFMAFSALEAGIELLQGRPDCASIVGNLGYFSLDANSSGGIRFSGLPFPLPGHTEIAPAERVAAGFRAYSNNFWAVYRKSCLERVLSICRGLSNHNVAEFVFKYGALMEGSIISIDRLLWLREFIPGSWGSREADGAAALDSCDYADERAKLNHRLVQAFPGALLDPLGSMLENYQRGLAAKAVSQGVGKRLSRLLKREFGKNPFLLHLPGTLLARATASRGESITVGQFALGMTPEEKRDLQLMLDTIRAHGPLDSRTN